MQTDTDIAESLTKLAFDYGPFLFAILFTLIVPVRAFQNFRDCACKFPEPTSTEQNLIRESELYFRSTWIAGFVLIAFSVGWWLYLNWDHLRQTDRNYWVKYEGDINVSTKDVLDAQHSAAAYVWKVYDPNNPHYHFIVLTRPPAGTPISVPLLWIDGQQQQGYDGVQRFSFQLDPHKTLYELKRTGAGLKIVADE